VAELSGEEGQRVESPPPSVRRVEQEEGGAATLVVL